MYGEETQRSQSFAQYEHDAGLRARGATALINLGISPGITNFLIGRRIHELRAAGRKQLSIERIDLDPLEDIDSDERRPPATGGRARGAGPAPAGCRGRAAGRAAAVLPPAQLLVPQQARPFRQYPLYQEELLSFRRAFPEIPSRGRRVVGRVRGRVVKSLFQLNLLSKRTLPTGPSSPSRAWCG